MNNPLITLLLCTSFGVLANTLPMATGHGSVVKIDTDENSLRAPERLPVMPGNDFCAGAIPITPSPAGASCTVSGFTLPFSTDGTTDSGVPTVCSEPVKDQWFTWTATTDGLNFASSLDNSAGIAIFASCDDANNGQAIGCFGPLGSGVLSGWDIGDELLIQIYDRRSSTSTRDVLFCLEAITVVTSDTPPVNDLCSGAIPIMPSRAGTGCELPAFFLPFASDGTTDSGVPPADFIEPFLDQWFTWTATTDVLEFTSKTPGLPGIVVFANCADANTGTAIATGEPFGAGQELSGWNIGDELIIQIYGIFGSPNSDVAFCLEDPSPPMNEPPVARCVATFTANLDADGNIALDPEDLNDGSSDDETPTEDLGLALDFGGPIPTCDELGLTITVTLIVTDGDGLSSSCTSQVRVRDNTAPEATCQNVAVDLPASGSFTTGADFLLDVVLTSFTDNCANAAIGNVGVAGGSTVTCDNLGVASRSYLYRDGNGQEDRCGGVRLQINDPLGVCNEAPLANCQPVTEVVADASVPFTINANAFDDGSTDDDGVYSLVFNPETDRQENSVRDCDITGEGLGMTFRPGQTGVIQSIRVRSGTAITTNLHIYGGNQGSGISGEVGTPDYSQPAELFFGQYDDAANLTTILLDEPFPVVEGQVYSFILEGETTLSRNCDGTPNNPGGRTLNNFADKDLNSLQDLTFQVNVIGETTREFSGIETTPVTVFAVDEQGNVSEGCETTFTLNQEGPVANCQPTAVAQVDAEGNVQLDPNDLNNGSTNGDGSTDGLIFSTDFSTDGLGCNDTDGDATVVTLTVANQAGFSATCTSLVTVEDNIGPTVTCRDTTLAVDPLTGELDVLAFSRVVPFTATDNCAITDTSVQFSIGTIYDCDIFRNDGVTNGPSTSVPGLSIRILDASNNRRSCFVRITLTDPGFACDDAPIASCVESLSVEVDENGNSNLSPADLNAGSTDTETPAADLVFSFDPTEGDVDCEDIGTGLVSLIVTDNVGKTDTCFTQVTVEDNLPPEATCQNVAVELNDNGRFGFSLGFGLNVILTDFVDNCAAVPSSASITGSTVTNCNDLGVITRSFFYRDGNGQEDLCNGVRIQITDPLGVCGEDPIVNCSPTTVTVDDLADTPALINANDFDNGSTDDRSVYTLVYSDATDRQENTVFDCSSTGFDQGQTFTAGQTGVIQSIGVHSGAAMNTELHLYNGNLANDPTVDPSAPDYTQDVELFFGLHSNQANLSVMTLDEPFPVVAGQEYTFVLDLESTLSRSCAGSAAYADGQPITGLMPQDDPGGQDFTFEVNIIGPTTQAFDSIGIIPVTVFAVDDQGNVSEGCETTVRVGQLTPIARCSTSVVAQLDENGAVILSPSDLDSLSLTGNPPSTLDEILTFTFGSDISSLDCGAAEDRTVIPVTLVVTRANGRSDNCVSMVTVQDTIPPVLVCREELVLFIDPETGIARFRSADAVISNVDNCGIRTLSSSGSPNFVCGDIGRIITKTVRTSDQSSNLSTCEVTVTITDPLIFCPANTPPTAVCRPTVEVFVQPDLTVPFAVDFLNDGSFDAESANNTLTRTLLEEDFAGFSCADVDQPRTLSLIVTDPQGLSDTCSTGFVILDPNAFCDEPPVAVCVETLTVELDEDGNNNLTPAELNNGSSDDNTPAAELLFSFDPAAPPLDCDAIGIQSVGLIVTDNVGKTDTCFTLVTVTETRPPVLENCPVNITVDTDPGSCFATVNFATPTVLFDPCDFPSADLTLEATLARYNNNIDALLATIPNRFVLEEDIENNNAFDDGGSDAYDGGNFMNTDFATEIQYSENVITTSDDFGTNSAYFTAYNAGVWMMAADVVDLTFYEINGDLGADGSGFIYAFEETYPITAGGATYRAFVKGVSEAGSDPTVNHLILVPDAPAVASQSFSDDTEDDEHRVAGLAGVTRIYQFNWYGQDDDGDGFAYSNAEIDAIVQAFIRFVVEPTTVVSQTAGPSSGSAFPVGDTEITFTATDPSGNSSDCSFTISVEDNELPQAIACPTDTTLFVNADSCRLSFEFDPVQFTDNCSEASILFVSDNLNGFEIPGQLAQLGFAVTTVFEDYVDDLTEDNTVLQGDLSSFDMIYWNASGESDFGDEHSQATTDNLLTYVLAGGHLFVTGNDVIDSPDDPNLIALLGGSGTVDRPDTDDQIYTVLGPENTLNSGLYDIIGLPIPPIGNENGLLGLNAETIVVLDSDPGQGARWALRTTTGGQIAWISTNNNGSGFPFPQWETPGSGYFEALRNFAFNNLRRIPFDGGQTAGPVSGSSFELGTTTLTFTGTDPSGNDATCSYNVTVLDTISPIVVCRDTTIALDAAGMASLSAEDLLDPSTVMMVDNCPFSLVADQTSFNCDDVGDNTVVLTATDDNGNEGSCTATVTVTASDLACDAPPLAICLETLTIELDEDGNTDLAPADLDNGSSDAVTPDEELIFSFDPAEGLIDCNDIGTLPVSLIVTDNDGQTDTCFTQVTVEDNIAPEATCQNTVFELRSNGRYVIVLDDILNSILTDYTDNCGELNTAAIVISGGTNFACGAIGENDKSFFFENDNDEGSQCDISIQITDPLGVCGEDPVVFCQPFTVTDTEEPTVTLNANVFDNGSTDDRSVYTLVYSDETDRQENTTFDCSTTGINQGQTFIAGQTGVIQSIKVQAGAATSNRLLIRDSFFPGDTVSFGGYTQNVDLFFGEHSDRANLTVINLDVPFPVTAGQQYFFQLQGETTLSRSCAGSAAYADGRPTQGFGFFSGSGDEDLTFEINIIGPTEQAFPTVGSTPVTVYAVDDQGNVSPGCITFVNPDSPLPVSWLSFGANAGAKTVDLQWETTEEPDNAGFHVERSATGNDWSAIGQVAAHTGSEQRYAFTDTAPLQGTGYYRLRQTDFNGQTTYSQVETVAFYADDRVIISPNPATHLVNIQLPAGAELLDLLDVSGKSADAHFSEREGQLNADVSQLPGGIYVLRTRLAGGRVINNRLVVH